MVLLLTKVNEEVYLRAVYIAFWMIITDRVLTATWRWCFYINLPIGGITMLVVLFFFTSPKRAAVANLSWKEKLNEFDIFGTLAFIPSIICLLIALQWGGTKYPWGNGRVIALFVVFGVLFVAFVAIQFWKKESATIPPSLMKNRSIASAAWFTFTLGSAVLLLIYYLPIWFQGVKGASAVKSGVMNLPMLLAMIIVSILTGVGVTVLGYPAPFMILSSIFMSVGVGLMYTFTPASDHQMWIGYQVLTGIGIGLGFQQPLIVVQSVLHISKVPIGTSVVIFMQILGGSIFISVGQNAFSNTLARDLAKYVPDINAGIILDTGATSIQQSVDPASLPGVVLAYNNALTQAFLVALIMSTLSIIGALFVEWKSVKGKKIEMAA